MPISPQFFKNQQYSKPKIKITPCLVTPNPINHIQAKPVFWTALLHLLLRSFTQEALHSTYNTVFPPIQNSQPFQNLTSKKAICP